MNPSSPNPPASPIAIMAREMTVRPGPVGRELAGIAVPEGGHLLADGQFLLREPGFAFHYRPGCGVTVDRGPHARPEEEALYLHGSVYAAVACLNGFLPVHASAVAVGGRVVAFTAPAGGGKSTLVAALAQLSLPLFCDDTLVLDLAGGGAPRCLPGHKRLKLWPDAVELTGAEPLEQVSAAYPKLYASPGGGDIAEMLPLAALVFLEPGEETALLPVIGGEKIARLDDDHYTRALFDRANPQARAARFAMQARIAAEVRMVRFVRKMDRADFAASTRYLAGRLSDIAGG